MDKDLLRIVIIAVGAVIVLGMVICNIFSKGPGRKKNDSYADHDRLENIDPSLVVNAESNKANIADIETGVSYEPNILNKEQQSEVRPEKEQSLPILLQLSIVAKSASGFTGIQLLEALENAGLIYGSVQVFEKLDDLKQVDYAVASMVDPGIFPGDNWASYVCHGITFFMQPRELGEAAQVFDEMLATIKELSLTLNGDVVDQNQQHLTEEGLQRIKASLV